jgi:hypothetical protein
MKRASNGYMHALFGDSDGSEGSEASDASDASEEHPNELKSVRSSAAETDGNISRALRTTNGSDSDSEDEEEEETSTVVSRRRKPKRAKASSSSSSFRPVRRRRGATKGGDDDESELAPISESFILHANATQPATPYDLGTRRNPFIRFVSLACGDMGVRSEEAFFKRPPDYGPRVSWRNYEDCLNSVVYKAIAKTSEICAKTAAACRKGTNITLDHVLASGRESLILAAAEFCSGMMRENMKKNPFNANPTKMDRDLDPKYKADALESLITEMFLVSPQDLQRF